PRWVDAVGIGALSGSRARAGSIESDDFVLAACWRLRPRSRSDESEKNQKQNADASHSCLHEIKLGFELRDPKKSNDAFPANSIPCFAISSRCATGHHRSLRQD